MTQLHALSSRQLRDARPAFAINAPTASMESAHLVDAITRARLASATTITHRLMRESTPVNLEDQLFTALANCKIIANQFAMHFGADWQRRFFAQLDALLSKEDWDPQDMPVTSASFNTLIRLLLTQPGKRRPGLGIGNQGRLIATWTAGHNRLTIECLPEDQVRWIVTQTVDDAPDTAAGQTTLAHLADRLRPYNPEQWFANEGSKSPT